MKRSTAGMLSIPELCGSLLDDLMIFDRSYIGHPACPGFECLTSMERHLAEKGEGM